MKEGTKHVIDTGIATIKMAGFELKNRLGIYDC